MMQENGEYVLSDHHPGTLRSDSHSDVYNCNDHIWNGMEQIIVYEELCEKFCQNEELRERLRSAEDAILAECAVKERIWGIG